MRVVVLFVGLVGCNSFGDICTEVADCAGGSNQDRVIEECQDQFDRDRDKAKADGCASQWDEWFACVEGESQCEDQDGIQQYGPGDRCGQQSIALTDCQYAAPP